MCQDVAVSNSSRQYGGVSAQDRVAERRARILEAGLELMGTRGVAGTTVRGVAEETGLAARYFYESFTTIDDLQVAVFDAIAVETLERSLNALARTSAADDATSRAERTHAVLAEMVDLMLEDPRKGRVVLLESLASPAIGARALEESRRFASLLAATASSGDPSATDDVPVELRITAQFMIGGVSQALGAVLQGAIDVDRATLVKTLVQLFLTVDNSRARA